ncbi:protein-tyrosine phosphatase [Streptomyces griseoaurantiacus]|uniref:protein-tyrosine-phosphatase n=1 Tax=Streptomyces griseoaurantiacus TaxID=68213 RepID=A0A1G7DZV0_9ACTN|nr:protein-tyrosine phosphatase [Streptomyces jietaisiensis]
MSVTWGPTRHPRRAFPPYPGPVHLCFVCTGNICRSPSAALVLAEHLRRAGLDGAVEVSSAGIEPWHAGEPIDERSGEVLARHGYPVEHVAAQLGAEHLDADLFLAMDRGHEKALRRLVADPSRVRMLRSFAPDASGGLDVPDPYYGGPEGFEEVLSLIEATVPGLLAHVRERLDAETGAADGTDTGTGRGPGARPGGA